MARVDGTLLASAVSGDRTATDTLLRQLRPEVLRYCRARLGDRRYRDGDADDCAQEVLLGVLGALPEYRYGAARFPHFVRAVAAHKVVDAYRHRGDDVSVPVPEFAPAPSDLPEPHRHVEVLELRRRVRLLLDLLVPAQRAIVVLRVMVGLSAEETAGELGVASSGAVRVSQHRALSTLRRHLTTSEVR
jgi:RNA polymerase sigma-70 factor, ECF subfamily